MTTFQLTAIDVDASCSYIFDLISSHQSAYGHDRYLCKFDDKMTELDAAICLMSSVNTASPRV